MKSKESWYREIVSKVMAKRDRTETDTGGRAENAKAYGRIRVKELGKMHT